MLFIDIPEKIDIKIGDDWIIIKSPISKIVKYKSKSVLLYKYNNKLYCLNEPSVEKNLLFSYINKFFTGLSKGFFLKLKIVGIGYKVLFHEKFLEFRLGYTHPIYYQIPQGITITTPKNKASILIIYGYDQYLVHQTAAEIRALKKPELYKGKGIRYYNEILNIKEGKKSNV